MLFYIFVAKNVSENISLQSYKLFFKIAIFYTPTNFEIQPKFLFQGQSLSEKYFAIPLDEGKALSFADKYFASDYALKFARKMKFYFRKVGLGHLKHISRVGQKDVASFAVFGHELMFASLEGFERFRVIALYPACFV